MPKSQPPEAQIGTFDEATHPDYERTPFYINHKQVRWITHFNQEFNLFITHGKRHGSNFQNAGLGGDLLE